jgi:hypothetical protein
MQPAALQPGSRKGVRRRHVRQKEKTSHVLPRVQEGLGERGVPPVSNHGGQFRGGEIQHTSNAVVRVAFGCLPIAWQRLVILVTLCACKMKNWLQHLLSQIQLVPLCRGRGDGIDEDSGAGGGVQRVQAQDQTGERAGEEGQRDAEPQVIQHGTA